MSGCKSVPNNQPLKWYQEAIENYGRGNGGAGKDYDYVELHSMYYEKLDNYEEKLYMSKMHEADEAVNVVSEALKGIDTKEFLQNIEGHRKHLENCYYCYKFSPLFEEVSFDYWKQNELINYTEKLLLESGLKL